MHERKAGKERRAYIYLYTVDRRDGVGQMDETANSERANYDTDEDNMRHIVD